jgi:hypothetical protein
MGMVAASCARVASQSIDFGARATVPRDLTDRQIFLPG